MSKRLVILGLVCAAAAPALGLDIPGITPGPGPGETGFPYRAECAMNLIDLGKRLQSYAAKQQGRLPAKLSDLFTRTSRKSLRSLICPGAKPTVVPGGFFPSYIYLHVVPGGRVLDPAHSHILAFDAYPIHQDGRNVLFSDMKVEYLKEADFQSRLEQETAEWKAKGKTLQPVEDDLIPLRDTERHELERPEARSTGSIYPKIVLVLALAIAILVVLLVLQSRKQKSGEG